jgi:hypothetical protein
MQKKILLEQVQQRMAVMYYQLKPRCYPSDQTKWFYPTLEDLIAKNPACSSSKVRSASSNSKAG